MEKKKKKNNLTMKGIKSDLKKAKILKLKELESGKLIKK